jgi:hypothetical protein
MKFAVVGLSLVAGGASASASASAPNRALLNRDDSAVVQTSQTSLTSLHTDSDNVIRKSLIVDSAVQTSLHTDSDNVIQILKSLIIIVTINLVASSESG